LGYFNHFSRLYKKRPAFFRKERPLITQQKFFLCTLPLKKEIMLDSVPGNFSYFIFNRVYI
tara:strand:- start:36 stop:218 length:183 start_codon:yes stop_codon:yes gene_type:complete